jgi:hypothetical protein
VEEGIVAIVVHEGDAYESGFIRGRDLRYDSVRGSEEISH